MTVDAMSSIYDFRRRQLAEADGLVGRCSQLCERVLASQGDEADASIVQLQHDCADWSHKWGQVPVVAVTDAEAACSESFEGEVDLER